MASSLKASDASLAALDPDCRSCVWLSRSGGFIWCEVFAVPPTELPPKAFVRDDGHCSAHLTDEAKKVSIRAAMRSNVPIGASSPVLGKSET